MLSDRRELLTNLALLASAAATMIAIANLDGQLGAFLRWTLFASVATTMVLLVSAIGFD